MSATNLVEVYRAKDSIEAQMLKNALDDAGIEAHVAEESVGMLYPTVWWAAARILVSEDDAPNAAVILRDLEKSREHKSEAPAAELPDAE